jgi:hypothetical protein
LWGRDGRELFYHTDESVMVLMVKREGVADSDAPPPQIVVVQHWFEELKRLVPTN